VEAMSEAEMPNNESSPNPTSQPTPPADAPAEVIGSNNSPIDQSVSFAEYSQLAGVGESLAGEGETAIAAENTAGSPIDEALTWQSDTDIDELVTLNHSLQKQNEELLSHVEQLEKLLDECHSALQLQMKRNQSLDNRLSEQTDELIETQQQATRLFRELEASHQVAQRQQILIETLSGQLETAQEQMAQLERECALVQQRYNEQAYNLSQNEMTIGELRSRLERQQRYTSQLKTALDKFIEMPTQLELTELGNLPTSNEIQYYPQNASARLRLTLKPQPIQPWSANTEATPEETKSEAAENNPAPVFNLPWQEEYPITELVLEQPNLETSESTSETPEVSTVSQTNSDADLPDLTPESTTNLDGNLDEQINQTEEMLWEELERLTQAAIEPIRSISSETPTPPQPKPPADLPIVEPAEEETAASAAQPELQQNFTSNFVPLAPQISDTLSEETTNSPAPVVYPTRPQKKIKSLAAIDLPSFPRLGSQPSK
jgi:hypothetical protein